MDFTEANFKISESLQSTTCYLSIREDHENSEILYLNLQECKGAFSKSLGGDNEYGLPLLETTKTMLLQGQHINWKAN